jgi:hypothetical protein
MSLLQKSWKQEEVVIPGNPGEGRGRPGIQYFQTILDSGFRGMTEQATFARGSHICLLHIFTATKSDS